MTSEMGPGSFRTWLRNVYTAWGPEFLGVGIRQLLLIFTRPSAVFYNLLAVVLFGGLGMWLTILLYNRGVARAQDLSMSILTYCLAIVGMSILDVFWREKAVRPIQILSLCLGALAVFFPARSAWIFFAPSPSPTAYDPYHGNAWIESLRFIILPAVCWLFVNIDAPRFANDPDAAVGGNPLQPLR